jgi:glycosyltransferase involved in cell wall biosynthesis
LNIVIASILKPLDDVRHFQKLGNSLAKLPNVYVHILGRETTYQIPKTGSNITFRVLFPSQGNLFQRLIAPWRLFFYLVKVKPEQVISCTNELLIVIILYKILFGTKIVYDIQENYAENIRNKANLGFIAKSVIATYIRSIEIICAKFIDQFWLAEACYERELPFVKGKFITLENKSLFFRHREAISLRSNKVIHLLFSGTIAKENGIFEAIELAHALHKIDNRYRLTIVGCCHQPETAIELEKLALTYKSFISLIHNTIPIEYRLIQENVLKADIGLICYQTQPNFKNKMPTKLYEYTTAGLPILLQNNPKWNRFCDDYKNAITIDFQNFNPIEIHQSIQNAIFYPNGNNLAKQHTWEEEVLGIGF